MMQDIAKKAQNITDINVSSAEQHSMPPRKKRSTKKLVLWIIGLMVLLGSIGTAGYFYMKYQDVKDDPKSVITEKNQAETTRVLESLKKNLLITETDAPTVARVEEPEKLQKSNQEFYKDIQKGDYLVIFPKRAIIFRESINQIINIAPIISTADLKTNTPTPTTSDTTETDTNN